MFRAICLVIVFGSLLAAQSVSICQADDTNSVVGTYDCVGKNSDGSSYKGTVTIEATKGSKDAFNVTWSVGGSEYVGVALLEGNKLSSSWAIATSKGVAVGIIVYNVDGETLKGRWTSYPGTGTVLTETLMKR